jgi:hypothetical protein
MLGYRQSQLIFLIYYILNLKLKFNTLKKNQFAFTSTDSLGYRQSKPIF